MLDKRIFNLMHALLTNEESCWGILQDEWRSDDYFGTEERIKLDGQWLYCFLYDICDNVEEVQKFTAKHLPDHLCRLGSDNELLALFRL